MKARDHAHRQFARVAELPRAGIHPVFEIDLNDLTPRQIPAFVAAVTKACCEDGIASPLFDFHW